MEQETKRLDWLTELLPGGAVAYENETPGEIERYLAVEYSDSEPVHAFGAETLEKLAEEMDQSDTTATHTDVWDLDERVMLRPISRTVGFLSSRPNQPLTRIGVVTVEPVFVPDAIDEAYIAQAKEDYNRSNDDVSIDDHPKTSRAQDEDGAWVAAWVWVTKEDAGICRVCGAPGAAGDDSYDEMCPSCADKTECQDCDAQVEADDPYFATPCGTFCPEHMRAHAKVCGICASEFDLEGPAGENNGN